MDYDNNYNQNNGQQGYPYYNQPPVNGGYYQYPPQQQYYAPVLSPEERDRKNIKAAGRAAGLCIIMYFVLQNLLTIPIIIPSLAKLYLNNLLFQNTIMIVLSICTVMLPFYLAGKRLERKIGIPSVPFEKVENKALAISLIALGVFICLTGNYITEIWNDLLKSIGLKLTYNPLETPTGVFDRFYYIIAVAIVPAMAEELAMRGVVLQSLRKYGDSFAIITSAVVFGLLHANLVQAPFAIIAGIGLGYVACITDNIWIPVIVHCINNAYSCVVSFMVKDIKDDALLDKVYLVTLAVMFIVTIAGSAWYMFIRKSENLSLKKSESTLKTKLKIKAYFCNASMIIAILIILVNIINYHSKDFAEFFKNLAH